MPRRTTLDVPVVVAMVVLLLGTAVVTGLWAVRGRAASVPSARAALAPVDGYPQRIGFDRPSSRLPGRPGPLAATMFDNDFGGGRNLGVTPRGRLWELPVGISALSPDGRLLLSGEQEDGFSSRLSVHDLATGEVDVLDGVGQTFDSRERRRFSYVVDPFARVHWSQDASMVLTQVGARPDRTSPRPMVLDVRTGTLTRLAGSEAAGFRSPTKAVTLSRVGVGTSDGLVVTTTDLGTGDSEDLSLRLASPWRDERTLPLEASVSPDGSTLLLVDGVAVDGPGATLRLFSLTDGAEGGTRQVDDWDAGRCALTWLGDDPVVPTRGRTAGSALVTADHSRPLVAVHHRMQSSCLELTPAALRAGPHEALFGTSTATWTWYFQPALALLLSLAGLCWLLGRRLWRTV